MLICQLIIVREIPDASKLPAFAIFDVDWQSPLKALSSSRRGSAGSLNGRDPGFRLTRFQSRAISKCIPSRFPIAVEEPKWPPQ